MIYLVIVVLIRFILFCNLLNLFTDGKNPYYSCLCEFVYVLRAYIQIVRCSLLRFYFALMLKSDEFEFFFSIRNIDMLFATRLYSLSVFFVVLKLF